MPPHGEIHPKAEYILGVDLARLGEDSSVFIIVEKGWGKEEVYVVFIGETKHKDLNDAIGRILFLNQKFNFNKIYIDATSMGAAVFDVIRERLGEHKIEGVVFTAKSKVDMYYNLKLMMERNLIKFPTVMNDVTRKLFYQLSDLRVKYKTPKGEYKKYESIHHSDRGHDDYCDALALACFYFRPGETGQYIPMIA